ncbi:MAG TPA: OmpW family outer membrane protein [Aquabacterium sp.]|uniref:OmpW/AlkL family protein n=1 Tax=Aquabacterium sp. TaxID=1872578 RepID=UPI002E312E34|nr:OmpW family outer membrane protein [Aquabacterium sp.]HEX5356708.1 OmpW family outer membrane protein [Aquabacterium sp.]
MHKFRAGIKTAALFTTLFIGSAHIAPAFAQANSIFPSGWDNNVRSRLFMRLGYTSAFTKTKSDDARDITGNVVSRQELKQALNTGLALQADCGSATPTASVADCNRYVNSGDANAYAFAGTLLFGGTSAADPDLNAAPEADSFFGATGLNGIGAPVGIKAKAQRHVGTPTISLGYWLDDSRKWLIEAYVLAAPLNIKIYGDGVRADGVTPNTVNGQHIASTKMLPPLVIGSYNFGDAQSMIRPYVGVGAMYAIFFDGRTTGFFDEYIGGKTTLTTKNTFGFGPFVGISSPINDDWHVNLSVGQVALKATSRLVTSNTQITSQSAVLKDFSATNDQGFADFPNLNQLGEDAWSSGDFTTRLMELVKRNRNSDNLGTYVREQKMKITNTIVTLSIGRSF